MTCVLMADAANPFPVLVGGVAWFVVVPLAIFGYVWLVRWVLVWARPPRKPGSGDES